MENKIIEQISWIMSPYSAFSKPGHENELKRKAIEELLAALEPFIPKWVRVEDELPPKKVRVLAKMPNGWIRYTDWEPYTNMDEDYFRKNFVEWQYVSTTHPYEQLLEKLKTNK